MRFTQMLSKPDFVTFHFLAIFNRISGFWPRKNFCNIQRCMDRPAIHKCAFSSFLTVCVVSCTTARIRWDNHSNSALQVIQLYS